MPAPTPQSAPKILALQEGSRWLLAVWTLSATSSSVLQASTQSTDCLENCCHFLHCPSKMRSISCLGDSQVGNSVHLYRPLRILRPRWPLARISVWAKFVQKLPQDGTKNHLLNTHSAATSKGATPSILLYTGQVLYAIPFIGGGGEA